MAAARLSYVKSICCATVNQRIQFRASASNGNGNNLFRSCMIQWKVCHEDRWWYERKKQLLQQSGNGHHVFSPHESPRPFIPFLLSNSGSSNHVHRNDGYRFRACWQPISRSMASTSFSKAEKSYVQTSLLLTLPLRGDGRSLHDFRTISLETGVSPLANGSARLDIGRNAHDGGGGTEVLAAVKLEVEDVQDGEGIDGGRVVCTVSWYVV
jgi:hypothetical protein